MSELRPEIRDELEDVFVQILNAREPDADWRPGRELTPDDADTVPDRSPLAA